MENQNLGQSNQQFNQPFGQQPLPNSTTVLVLGIISLVFGVIWCYWLGSFIALVLGIIALVEAKSCQKLYQENQSVYAKTSYDNMNAGKVCAIIGLVLGALAITTLIFLSILGAAIFKSMLPY